jgi:hypothetical protein
MMPGTYSCRVDQGDVLVPSFHGCASAPASQTPPDLRAYAIPSQSLSRSRLREYAGPKNTGWQLTSLVGNEQLPRPSVMPL